MIRKSGNRFSLATNAERVCAEIMLTSCSSLSLVKLSASAFFGASHGKANLHFPFQHAKPQRPVRQRKASRRGDAREEARHPAGESDSLRHRAAQEPAEPRDCHWPETRDAGGIQGRSRRRSSRGRAGETVRRGV